MAFLLFAAGCDSTGDQGEKNATREAPPELCEQYSSYENLKASGDVDKLIEDTLEQLDIPMSEDKEEAYLSYRLGNVSEWSKLVNALPSDSSDEFCDVFRSAVRHAHYAYSLENYLLAPADIEESVFDVVVEGIGYELSAGSEGFESYVEQAIADDDDTVFSYPSVDYSASSEAVADSLEFQNSVVVMFAWRNGSALTLDTFRDLTVTEQADILRRIAWANLVLSAEREISEEEGEFLDALEANWPHVRDRVLGSERLRSLPADQPFGKTFSVVTDVWFED